MSSVAPLREPTSVLAVVVTRGVTAWLPDTLRDLAAQRRAPDRVFVAVLEPAAVGEVKGLLRDHGLGEADVVPAAGSATFGDAVRTVLLDHPATRGQWLWLLHDDSAPRPTALAIQLQAAEHASSVVIAGAKHVEWDAPDELISVGVGLTAGGRRFTALEEHEIDQGQYDDRSDVVAVPIAGALVRRDVWDQLGGPDPALGPYGDGADLARRARLAGHRVMVAPDAVVRHARASYHGRRGAPEGQLAPSDPNRSWSARRRAVLHSRLAAASPLGSVLTFFWMFLLAPVRALGRLATKEFSLIGRELRAPFQAALGLPAVGRARSRARSTAVLPRRVLRPLQVSLGTRLAAWRDARLHRAALRRTARARSELEIAEAAQIARRRRLALLIVLVVTVAAALVSLWRLVFAGALTGGGLLPVDPDLGGLWDLATSPWLRTGDGHPGTAQPLLLVLAALTTLLGGIWGTPVSAAVTLLVVGAVPLAGIGAWYAVGAATRSRSVRIWAALAWAFMPPLLVSLAQGRLGAVLAHLALPWVALGIARALGVHRRDVVLSGMVGARRVHAATAEEQAAEDAARARAAARPAGSFGAATAAGLALAVAAAGAPVLLAVAVVVIVVLMATLPGARSARVAGKGRLLLVLAPALVLLGPSLTAPFLLVEESGTLPDAVRLLLAEPTLPVAYQVPLTWQQGLLWPLDPASLVPTGPWLLIALAVPATVVVGAVVALMRGGGAARTVRVAWLVAVVALAAAVVVGVVPVGLDATGREAVSAWTGAPLSLLLLALLVAAAVGADGARTRLGSNAFGLGQLGATALAVVVFLGPLLAATGWIVLTRTSDPVQVEARGADPVPALGRQLQSSTAASRVLSLVPGPDGLDVQLWRGNGPQLLDAVLASGALQGGLLDASVRPPDGATQALAVSVARLTISADEAVPGLVEHAIGAVVIPPTDSVVRPGADANAVADLAAQLDGTAGLERVTSNASGTVWRVVDPGGVARARVLDAAGAPSDTIADRTADLPVGGLASTGNLATGELLAHDGERVLVLAERTASGWSATLDGVPLDALSLDWRQAWTIPAGAAGTLLISYDDPAHSAWDVAQIVVLGLTALLALPTRRREGA